MGDVGEDEVEYERTEEKKVEVVGAILTSYRLTGPRRHPRFLTYTSPCK